MQYKAFFSIPLFLVLFIQILPFSHGNGFYAPSSGHIPETNSSNKTITITSNTINNTVINVTGDQIKTAEVYLSKFLGSFYYSKYINYSGSYLSNDIAEIYFNYSVPFNNGSVMRISYSEKTAGKEFGIMVKVSQNNTVVGYSGPIKPYFVNITSSEAEVISRNNGLSNVTLNGIGGISVSNSSYTSNSEYYIAWAIQSTAPYYPNTNTTKNYYTYVYKGLYIDSNNGSVLGEYLYSNSTILSSIQNMTLGYAGRFDLYNLTQTNTTKKQNNQSITNSTVHTNFVPNYGILFWIFAIAILVVILIYAVFRYMMHK